MRNRHHKHLTLIAFIIVIIIVITDTAICTKKDIKENSKNTAFVVNEERNQKKQESQKNINKNDDIKQYICKSGKTVKSRFNTPKGYKRCVLKNSFGEFLENYPLYKAGKKISLYNGEYSARQDAHVAVFKMKMTDGDLQQCADSVMRLYAEYYYSRKKYNKIKFHLTNGFEADFSKWIQGMRIKVDGNSTYWVKSGKADSSYKAFNDYLRFVFAYAGTLSMVQESKKVSVKNVQPGDLFIYGGSPGHVEMVVDVCENKSGDRAFLLGQGYMPAQQFHILKNPEDENNPWYFVSKIKYPFETAGVTFKKGTFMRPKY